MSEHLTKDLPSNSAKPHSKNGPRTRAAIQAQQPPESEAELQSDHSGNAMTYSQAQKLCEEQMLELQQKIQDLSPQEQQDYIEQAQIRCNEYLSRFLQQQDLSDEASKEDDSLAIAQQQQQLLALQQLQALGLGGLGSPFNATADLVNPQNQGLGGENASALLLLKEQALQQQQASLFLQQMSQNISQKEMFAQLQAQYKQALRQQMGNQLRNFARHMFSKINQRQKKKLHKEAKHYLDLYIQDQKKLQQHLNSASTNPSLLGSGNAYLDSTGDFEYQADPQKYLDEVEGSLRKHKDLAQNFQRFIQKVFDDPEQEQVFTDFMINYQDVYSVYHSLAINYNYAQHQEEEDKQEMLGTQIFNLIMPFAQKIDPKLLNLIPKEILEKFKIEYEPDNIHIKSWEQIELSDSDSSGSDGDDEFGSNPSDQSGSSNEHIISTNSQMIGESSDQDLDDGSNELQLMDRQRQKDKGLLGYQYEAIPQSAITGKNKSLSSQLNFSYPNLKSIKTNDIRPLDNLFKSLKDEKDWVVFCKILYLYFEGVFSLTEFMVLYEDKFANRLKQEIKDEIEKLIPTRDQNRRALSNILKPWNDTENQTFEKIPDSSYYKIEDGFPIPTCTRKMMFDVYLSNINDQYLSLATGSENFKFKFRNTYEELIYKTEDKIYELDSQIDNITKSFSIVSQQCSLFDLLPEDEQAVYKFPVQLLGPLRFYWDQKFRKGIHEMYFKDNKVLKAKDMANLKQQFAGKLEFLRNHKSSNLNEFKDAFRKNFTKSLDHKSFQYKDFMKKYLQKQNHVKWIKQILEDNDLKRRLTPNQINLLYGSGDQSVKSDYRFYNSYGKEFSGCFSKDRLKQLERNPDHPIDMRFMDDLPMETIYKLQHKCPQSRFIMNDKQAFEITLKLVIQFIKLQQPANNHQSDKAQLLKALKFMVTKFLKFDNFDEVETDSEQIQPLTIEMIDVLMNSALYYHKKYTREIGHMEEVFPIEDPSLLQSPTKNISKQPSEANPSGKVKVSKSDSCKSQQEDADMAEQPANSQTSFKFKGLAIKQEKLKELEQLEQDFFIPRFVNDHTKPRNERYQLFYAPLNIYMFLVYFYSVYERVLKAKELVSKKVFQDFEDDFSQMEWSLKFSTRRQTLIDERFSYLIKAILTLMSQNNVLDSQKYEDIARELLGNEAYLLFQVDKLVNYCQKQLQLFEIDNNCIAATKLFHDFQAGKMEDETEYLSTFYKVANQQALVTKDILNQKLNGDKSSSPVLNKENMNPNMNLQAFRIMYSPKSCIVTCHFMVLHPFFMQEQKKLSNAPQPIQCRQPINPINGEINEQETVDGLYNITTQPMQLDEGPLPLGEVDTSPQIYLNRNLKLMRGLRGKDCQSTIKNRLKLSLIPLTHQMAFEPCTEDIVVFKRTPENSKQILSKRRFSQISKDLEFQAQAQTSLLKRLKQVNEETGHSEINVLLEVEQQESLPPKSSQKESAPTPEVVDTPAPVAASTRKTRSVTNSNQKQQSSSKRADDHSQKI